MKLQYFIPAIFILSCNNPKANEKPFEDEKAIIQRETKAGDKIFKGKVVVILSEELKPDSQAINLQDYIKNGKSFIPVFSSIEKFDESTKGAVKNQKIEIDGIFLLSVLHGNETLILDPGLEDETSFGSAGLIEKYAAEIQKVRANLKTLQEK